MQWGPGLVRGHGGGDPALEGQESTWGREGVSERCTGDRRFKPRRERGSGWLKMGEATVHHGQRPWTCSGELVEG